LLGRHAGEGRQLIDGEVVVKRIRVAVLEDDRAGVVDQDRELDPAGLAGGTGDGKRIVGKCDGRLCVLGETLGEKRPRNQQQ
jgi:hypothetical protein